MSSRHPQFTRCALVALLLAILSIHCLSNAAAAQADNTKGSITGTVTDAAGKPMSGLQLRLEQDVPRDVSRPGDTNKPGGGGGTKLIARATTGADGKFSFQDLSPGGYRIVAGNSRMGWIYQDIQVEAGKELNLDDLKLAK